MFTRQVAMLFPILQITILEKELRNKELDEENKKLKEQIRQLEEEVGHEAVLEMDRANANASA